MKFYGIKARLTHILHLDEPPHELAKAFAAGVFVAFTPTIGLHTLTVLLIAWAFRLNKLVALTGTFINNPWTIPVIYIGPTWVMVRFMRSVGMHVPPLNYDAVQMHFLDTMEQYSVWQPVFWQTFVEQFKPFIYAFLVGTTLAGVAAALTGYLLALAFITNHRAHKAKEHKE